jgi:hypothetical protein
MQKQSKTRLKRMPNMNLGRRAKLYTENQDANYWPVYRHSTMRVACYLYPDAE